MRVQRVPPGRVVVHVASSCSCSPSAAAITRLLWMFSSAAPQVSTAGAAPVPRPPPSTSATNAVTRAQRENPRSWPSSSGTKKLPDCRKSPANAPACRCWACSIASAPSEAPIATGAPRTATSAPTAGSTPRTSAPAYSGEAEYHSLRGPGASSATRCGGSVPLGDRGGAEVRQPRQLRVLGAVVGHEQRQRVAVAGVGRAPDPHRDVPPEATARSGQLALGSLGLRRVQPRRRLVAVQQQHRLLPERAGRAQRVGGVEDQLAAAVRVHQLQLVLEPGDRRRADVERPVLAGALVLERRQVGAEAHGRVALVRIGEAQQHAEDHQCTPFMSCASAMASPEARSFSSFLPLAAADSGKTL